MKRTDDLVARLAADARPVHVLRPPLVRAAGWIAAASGVIVLLGLWFGPRPDLSEKLADPTFAVQVLAALATAMAAAVAAFHLSVPGRPLSWALLPVPPLAVWASVLGYGCIVNWVAIGPEGITSQEALRCLRTIGLVSAPLLLILPAMLRHAAVVRGGSTSVCGMLAVGAFAAVAVSLIHDVEATLMVLVLNAGLAGMFLLIGATVGPRVLTIAHHVLQSRRYA